MSITLTALQKQRRDTAANWTAANPTLLAGEIGLESDTGYWKVGDGSTAWNSLAYVTGLGGEIPVSRLADGSARQLLQTAVNGTDVEWTSNVDVPGTLDVTGAATFDGNVTVQGDLTVNGTTTTIDTTNLAIEDKNIEIGKVATPTDATADGGGITLKGTTDKTINWVDATDAWTFSEHVNIASGKEYRIAGTKVLDATSLGSGVLITSSNITDGTIVDGDINASAAIAGTKISPDFGSQTVTTTGVISAALGAAATPSLTFTGDLNTGIYSPGADQVAISTGGSGRLFVDASGRVGINKAIPSQTLQVVSATGGTTARFENTSSGNFVDFYETTGGTRMGYIGHTSATDMYIHNDTAGPLIFDTNNTERLRITSTGLVGIGTSSPITTLNIAGSALPSNELGRVAITGDTTAKRLAIGVDSSSTMYSWIQSVESGVNSRHLILQPLGSNVGIGTASPGYKLDVAGTIKSTDALLIDLTNGDLTARELGGNSANNTIEFHIRPNSGKSGYLTFTEDSVDDRWSIGIQNGNGGLRFISGGPTSGTERARLTSSGQWLMGTSSSRSVQGDHTPQIQLEGTSYSSSTIGIIANTNDANGSYLFLGKSRGTTVGSNTIVQNNDALGQIRFIGSDGVGDFSNGATIEAVVDGTPGSGDLPCRLVFSTTADGASSPTERMRITNGGQVCINRTSVVSGFNSTLNIDYTTGSQYGIMLRNTAASTFSPVLFVNSSNTLVGEISCTTTSTSYVTSSDYRLKENVVAVTDGITRLQQLKPSRFNFIADPGKTVDGFIAHEVQDVVPEAIHGTKDKVDADGNPIYQGIDQSKLVPLLTAALQEAIGRIETLEAEVAALKAQ